MTEQPQNNAKRHSRLWLYAPWALFVLGAIAWCVYWLVLAQHYETRIAAWVAAQEQAGGEAHVGAITRQGFPAMLRFELTDVAYAPREHPFALSTAHMTLHVNLTDPRHFYLERKAPFTLTHGDDRSNLDASTAILSLALSKHGLSYAGLEADRITLDNPEATGVFTLGHIVANMRPDPRNAEDWQLALTLSAIHLARPVTAFEPLGQDIADLQGAIVWTPAQRARIEGLELQWGEAHANVLGEIGMDDAHRLSGSLNVTAPRDTLRLPPSALRAAVLARQPTQDPIAFTLDADDGALRVEGRAVRDLAPLY